MDEDSSGSLPRVRLLQVRGLDARRHREFSRVAFYPLSTRQSSRLTRLFPRHHYISFFQSSSTRLETVKALSTLYADPSNASSLSSFTERFKRRLLQMAFHDIDLSVRTTAIGILNHVDRSGMLDDEKRRQVGLLVFDSEGRVRKAVAGFFEGRWEEERDEMLEEIEGAQRRAKKSSQTSGRKKVVELEDQEVLKTRIGWKCLASMLVRFSHALDDASAPLNDDDESLEDPSARDAAEELKAWVDMAPKGRIGSAVESLWDKVENLRDWEGLVEFLGLDHSTGEDEDEETVDANGWKLDEDEEGCLIQVLVAGLRKVKAQAEKQVSCWFVFCVR